MREVDVVLKEGCESSWLFDGDGKLDEYARPSFLLDSYPPVPCRAFQLLDNVNAKSRCSKGSTQGQRFQPADKI